MYKNGIWDPRSFEFCYARLLLHGPLHSLGHIAAPRDQLTPQAPSWTTQPRRLS